MLFGTNRANAVAAMAAAVVFLAAQTVTMVDAFGIVPSPSAVGGGNYGHSVTAAAAAARGKRFAEDGSYSPATIRRMATVETETELEEATTMSDQDEEVLFGKEDQGKSSAGSSSSASAGGAPYPNRHRKKSRTGVVYSDRTIPKSTLALDHSTTNPLVNKLRTMRDTASSCPALWRDLSEHCPDAVAIIDNHLSDSKISWTYREMDDRVRRSAAAFRSLGVAKGKNVAVLGENSAQWLTADHGIQLAGGASAVRGADAPPDELRYIYEHSDSAGIAVLQGPKLFQRLASDARKRGLDGLGLSNDKYGPVRTVVLMHREKKTDEQIADMVAEATMGTGGKEGATPLAVHVLDDLLKSVEPLSPFEPMGLGPDDLSTIVYTSGTTGRPKGVMLTHGNLLHQMSHRLAPNRPYDETEPLPGDCTLALLPVWHITERTFELWILSRGCTVIYSSIRTFKNDLAAHKPRWMVLVPRVLEKVASGVQDKFASGSAVAKALVKVFTTTGTLGKEHSKIARGLVVGSDPPPAPKRLASAAIVAALAPINAVGNKLVWSKVQDGFGGRVATIISGGSALAGSLESFYELCGITICVGYGLTECSPLIAHRRSDANLVAAGCVGKPACDTELRIVDPELDPNGSRERPALPNGEVGVVVARGPQVMKGYYKNREATDKAIDRYGWFDTGDLGRVNPATGDIILTGRCKDTIVLSNGENIEPSPIEDAILSESALVDQICLTGQDGRSLAAIAVLNPTELVQAGFLDEKRGKELQEADEKVNDPKLTADDVQEECDALRKASDELRSDDKLKNILLADMKRATKDFRSWERVSDVYITLEPFAMSNGLLTQSYKVKRDAVMNRYGNKL